MQKLSHREMRLLDDTCENTLQTANIYSNAMSSVILTIKKASLHFAGSSYVSSLHCILAPVLFFFFFFAFCWLTVSSASARMSCLEALGGVGVVAA